MIKFFKWCIVLTALTLVATPIGCVMLGIIWRHELREFVNSEWRQ